MSLTIVRTEAAPINSADRKPLATYDAKRTALGCLLSLGIEGSEKRVEQVLVARWCGNFLFMLYRRGSIRIGYGCECWAAW